MSETKTINLYDVLSVALTNETLGAKFYAAMAGNSEKEDVRDVFYKLAEEEKEHRHLFQTLIEQYKDNTEYETISGNKIAYFKFLAENNIFATIIEAFKQRDKDFSDIGPKDALSIGIQAEKDSILLYQELYESTSHESVKEAISKLLEEEKMHLLELRQQLEEF
jgi:rubrerythrin